MNDADQGGADVRTRPIGFSGRPNRHADQINDQPPRRDARDLIDIVPWGNLHHVHPNHATFVNQPMDQLARLLERHAAGTGRCHGRRDRRIHAIEVHRQVIARAVGDPRQNGIHAGVVQLPGGDQVRAGSE